MKEREAKGGRFTTKRNYTTLKRVLDYIGIGY